MEAERADAVRQHAARARLHAATSTSRAASSCCSATACAARGLPSGVNNVRATYRKGLGVDGNVGGRQAHAADDAAARPEERQQPGRRRGRHRSGGRRRRRGGRCRCGRARSAARCRCSTTKTSRSRSPASPRRRPQVLQLPAGPTIAITVAGPGGVVASPGEPGVEQPARGAGGQRRPARRGARCSRTRPAPSALGLKVKRDPAYESRAGARGGRSGAARALRVRGARAAASRCSSPT